MNTPLPGAPPSHLRGPEPRLAILTGGGDRPYALGLAFSLMAQGIAFDLIGSDEIDAREFHGNPLVRLLNLRGSQCPDATRTAKVTRVLRYYVRLLRYAAVAKPTIFHVLWNNKFELFDRTVLMAYYRLLGKRVVLTAHNVNAGQRDATDSALNRQSLKLQYHLAHHIFVHTSEMQRQLSHQFNVPAQHISVIPFGINSTVPTSALTPLQAKQRLGIAGHEKVLLFFGNIAPYKGLDCLIEAFALLPPETDGYRLIVAGRPKNCPEYWETVREQIGRLQLESKVILHDHFIPDEETEIYFKAADVLILPYRHIFQSGVLFLGYNFGLPAIVSDVGSLSEDIIVGKTGFVFRRDDPPDLAAVVAEYFRSSLFLELDAHRKDIREFAAATHSWSTVAELTIPVYTRLS